MRENRTPVISGGLMSTSENMEKGPQLLPHVGKANGATGKARLKGQSEEAGSCLSHLYDLMQGHGVTITRDLLQGERRAEGSLELKIVIGGLTRKGEVEFSLHRRGIIYNCLAWKREGTLSPEELKKRFGKAGVQVPVVFA
jgi:hypothetical protein